MMTTSVARSVVAAKLTIVAPKLTIVAACRCERPTSCVGRFGEFTPAQWVQFYQRVGSMTLRWSLRDTDVTFLHE
jgi:hypothetical protein